MTEQKKNLDFLAWGFLLILLDWKFGDDFQIPVSLLAGCVLIGIACKKLAATYKTDAFNKTIGIAVVVGVISIASMLLIKYVYTSDILSSIDDLDEYVNQLQSADLNQMVTYLTTMLHEMGQQSKQIIINSAIGILPSIALSALCFYLGNSTVVIKCQENGKTNEIPAIGKKVLVNGLLTSALTVVITVVSTFFMNDFNLVISGNQIVGLDGGIIGLSLAITVLSIICCVTSIAYLVNVIKFAARLFKLGKFYIVEEQSAELKEE